MQSGGDILILVQYDAGIEEPTAEDMAPVGILGRVDDVLRAPQGGVQMLVELRDSQVAIGVQSFLPVPAGEFREIVTGLREAA